MEVSIKIRENDWICSGIQAELDVGKPTNSMTGEAGFAESSSQAELIAHFS